MSELPLKPALIELNEKDQKPAGERRVAQLLQISIGGDDGRIVLSETIVCGSIEYAILVVIDHEIY